MTQDLKKSLIDQIEDVDPEKLKKVFNVLSMMIRAFEGKSVDEKDSISRLINLNDEMERSRFPSMRIINFQVYCRLLKEYHPELAAYEKWADFQASALIAYKGLNWEAYTKMTIAQYGANLDQAPQTNINLTSMQKAIKDQQQKRHWWSRKPKTEEFKE